MRPIILGMLGALLWPFWVNGQTRPPLKTGASQSVRDSLEIENLCKQTFDLLEAGKPSQAYVILQQARQLANELQDSRWLGRVAFSEGNFYRLQEDFGPAIIHFQQALTYYNLVPRPDKRIETLERIALIYEIVGDLNKAEAYHQQALNDCHQFSQTYYIPDVYGNLANLAGIRKHYKKSLYYNQKAVAIYRKEQDWDSYYRNLLNQAITYKNLNRLNQSERIYLRCLAYAHQYHNTEIEGYVYLNLPNTLVLQNRLVEAELMAKKGLQWAQDSLKSHRVIQEPLDILGRIKEKQGDYRQALSYVRQLAAHHDSVISESTSKQIAIAETRFQTRQKQEQIQQLNENNKRQTQQMRFQFGGISLLLILLALTGWQYVVIRRINSQLEAKNQLVTQRNDQITAQAAQLKLLMKELHHRVKNNLAIVAGLLYLQSNRLSDDNAVRAVREGQQRVEAMSLIHQRLYQGEDVTRVNMRDYIHDLVSGLILAYGYDPNQFKAHIDIQHAEIDVDLAVPVGLILNELVTNAFKHAFSNIPTPALYIYLGINALKSTDELVLEVADNGPGVDLFQWQQPGSSFGKRLIQSLCQQIGAHLAVMNQSGAKFRLRMPVEHQEHAYA